MDPLLERYVSVDSMIQHGKPCFRGTRIPVYVILELLEGGVRPEAIVGQDYYPELTLEHVRAALHFAAQYAKYQEYLPLERPAQTGA
jgi:uncharacterized protein (DUF433 family)